MNYFKFFYPEPLRKKKNIIPIFIPFIGCPSRCIYCAQHMQTGSTNYSLEKVYAQFEKTLEHLENKGKRSVEIAFFGGTFTGISPKWIQRFLLLAKEFKKNGIIRKIRCSTRPDYITRDKLNLLKELDLDIIELGIQSFDDNVLYMSNRGYSGELAKQACWMVKEVGFELGIQLLPGLPGFSSHIWHKDIKNTILIDPKFVRIYPCVVLKGTILEKKYLKGEYVPLGLERSIRLVSLGVLKLWRHNIPVIRIGLHNETTLEKNIIAGPWDPGYGSLVKSYILFKILTFYIIAFSQKNIKKINIPYRFQGMIWGRGGRYRHNFKNMGINKEQICFFNKEYFEIVW